MRSLAFTASFRYLLLMPQIAHLECSRCHQLVSAETPQTLCPHCAGVLYVRYDLSSARGTAVRDRIAGEAGTAPSARHVALSLASFRPSSPSRSAKAGRPCCRANVTVTST